MLFNSLDFAIFLPLAVGGYFLAPHRGRTAFLLAASAVFYMAFRPAYILILALTIAIDYFAGLGIAKSQGRRRKALLGVSILATCAVLAVFKYADFALQNAAVIANAFGWHAVPRPLDIVLPIGLSFHTFQSLSYVVEVYRGAQPPERNFVTYATYVMFFPQLVAGPIERPQRLLHQFGEVHVFDEALAISGLKRIAWGLFKKIVIADRLALYVNDVYAAPSASSGVQLSIATVFFAYQIYCDFSGYSDIAVGTARLMGFRLMENFSRPYHSTSVAELWARWHISLSSWFRDYVYIPLGGNRVPPGRRYVNLLTTFALSGLWHGASWNFVLWGVLNGVFLVLGLVSRNWRDGLWKGLPAWLGLTRHVFGVATVFLAANAGWVLFRSSTLADALYVYTHFWRDWDVARVSTPQFLLRQMPVAIGAIVVLELVEYLQARGTLPLLLARVPIVARWPAYAAALLAMCLLGVYRSNQFIYFQF